MATDWWKYVEKHMKRLDWPTMSRLARESGVDRSNILRWKQGKGVHIDSVRKVAAAFGRPLAEAISHAGTSIEAGDLKLTVVADPRLLTSRELAEELLRRVETCCQPGHNHVAPASPLVPERMVTEGGIVPERQETTAGSGSGDGSEHSTPRENGSAGAVT